MNEPKSLDELREFSAACQNCALGATRRQIVFGEGNPSAEIFLLGEAPGAKEDETGRPFIGRAGEVLTELLAQAGIDRTDVFITGSCKCRPPKNRNPHKKELAACLPIVQKQIAFIRPKVVVCLGLIAVHNILDPKARLADVRGKWFANAGYRVYPTYHPAAVLRGTVKAEILIEDFRCVRAYLDTQ